MKRVKTDKKRGATYESGINLKYSTPPEVEAIDAQRKEELKVECNLKGCYVPGHTRRSSKACTYYKCPKEELENRIESNLRKCFPSYYGKSS